MSAILSEEEFEVWYNDGERSLWDAYLLGATHGQSEWQPRLHVAGIKCERLTAAIEDVLADLVGENTITQNEVYDRLHTAVYGEQFEKEAE